MKNKILNFIFAYLIGCLTPFSIFIISGKHQQTKESYLQVIDTFQIIDKMIDPDNPDSIIYTTQNRKEYINYYWTSRKFVKGYDEIYYSVKK
jgi:hypothetical protein